MPLRQAGYLQCNYTEHEIIYLLNEYTCVIDNLVWLYGKELELNRENKESQNYQIKQRIS
jgi:hypothetical protein